MMSTQPRRTSSGGSDQIGQRVGAGNAVVALSPSVATEEHDGLLLLAALTGNREILRAWLRLEQAREDLAS
jgi:hypothetical protein